MRRLFLLTPFIFLYIFIFHPTINAQIPTTGWPTIEANLQRTNWTPDEFSANAHVEWYRPIDDA